MTWYPKEIYCSNIAVTRENMRRYDMEQKKIRETCYQICSNYDELDLRQQYEIRTKAKEIVRTGGKHV